MSRREEAWGGVTTDLCHGLWVNTIRHDDFRQDAVMRVNSVVIVGRGSAISPPGSGGTSLGGVESSGFEAATLRAVVARVVAHYIGDVDLIHGR